MAEESKEKRASSIVGDATKAVNDAWQFFFPPIMRMAICIGIAIFLGGGPFLKKWLGVYPGAVASWNSHHVATVLEDYKLTPLIPVAAVFILAAVAYTWNRIVFLTADVIPPSVSFNPVRLLIQNRMADDLWTLYPEIGTVELLVPAIDLDIQKAREDGRAKLLENVDYWEKNAGDWYQQLSFCKFVAVWTFCWMLALCRYPDLHHRAELRSLAILPWISVIAAIIVLRYCYALNQAWLSKRSAVLLLAAVSGKPALQKDDPKWAAIAKDLELLRGQGWWWIQLVPSFWFLDMIAGFDAKTFVFQIYGQWAIRLKQRWRP